MLFLRACLFSLGIFVALTIISLLVAGMIKIIYSTISRNSNKKKPVSVNEPQTPGLGKVA